MNSATTLMTSHTTAGRSTAGAVRVFRQKFPLEDAIGSHAFAPLLDGVMCVTNGIPLGRPLLLLVGVGTVNCVRTLQRLGVKISLLTMNSATTPCSAGMEYLALGNNVHRDLATRNCLVGAVRCSSLSNSQPPLATSGQATPHCNTARCSSLSMPLVPTPLLLSLKLLHACDQ